MARGRTWRRLGIIIVLVLLTAGIAFVWPARDDSPPELMADVTIYLSGDILSKGGTVIVLPVRDQSAFDWTPDNNWVQLVVSNRLSIVYFDYPANGKFVFRFGTLDANLDKAEGRTKLLSVGSGGYRDDATGKMVELEDIQTIMVQGFESSEEQSRRDEFNFTDVLREGASCEPFPHARVCHGVRSDKVRGNQTPTNEHPSTAADVVH